MGHEESNSKPTKTCLHDLVEPFCCQRVIPLAFRHLVTLLPIDQTYVPLRSVPRPANPILTSFVTAAALTSIRVDRGASFSIRTFQAIIRTTKYRTSGDQLPDGVQYYALLAESKFVTNRKEKLLDGGGQWLRISPLDAEDCIRPEGSGIVIGNGENWERLNGEDRMWCDQHQCFWKLEAWAQVWLCSYEHILKKYAFSFFLLSLIWGGGGSVLLFGVGWYRSLLADQNHSQVW